MSDLKLLRQFTFDEDGFFGRYEELITDVVIPYQENALNDRLEGVEKSHCIENFRMAAEKLRTGSCQGEFYGMVFQDSDVAKWLEGAAYSLLRKPDEELAARCDEIIELIGSAQQEDGYLNTYFTVKQPGRQWTNLQEAHELYCAGHMIEAAVAYAECTGKKRLLEIMCKMADNIYERFVTDGMPGFPGHPEIELALVRLYRATGEKRYLELAVHFIDVRGAGDYFLEEKKKRDWTVWGADPADKEYTQCEKPVREQTEAVGHAVRAVYLYTGMADAAKETGDEGLAAACRRLWDNLTNRRMYVTGGIGSTCDGEAFTKDFHLPNDTAYSETCAAIGLVFFARRMLMLEKNSRYADVMERALYNGVLAGMELDGTKFFYVNPLEVQPGISGATRTQWHVQPVRPGWFSCACCPPNVARLLPSLAEYAWGVEEKIVYSHLFLGGTLKLDTRDVGTDSGADSKAQKRSEKDQERKDQESAFGQDTADKGRQGNGRGEVPDTGQNAGGQEFAGSITLKTGYPYDGKVTYRFSPEREAMELTLAIRLPGWCESVLIRKNGNILRQGTDYEVKDGYAYLSGCFTGEDEITVNLEMKVRHLYANTKVSADSGKTALQYGPLIYCAEGVDNGGDVLGLCLKRNGKVGVSEYLPEKLYGIRKLYAEGIRVKTPAALYSYEKPQEEETTVTLVPYYTWANRGLNEMRVWLPER